MSRRRKGPVDRHRIVGGCFSIMDTTFFSISDKPRYEFKTGSFGLRRNGFRGVLNARRSLLCS